MMNKKQGKMRKQLYAIPSDVIDYVSSHHYMMNIARNKLFNCVRSKKSEMMRYEVNFEGRTP